MELTFYAKDKRWIIAGGLGERTCSIKDIKFQDCETEYPQFLFVNSSSAHYQSKGTFYCANGTHMFPMNRSTETRCMANAEWRNNEGFKCYGAPNDTRIEGNLEIKENETMETYCKFTQTVPYADQTKFSFGGNTSVVAVNETLTRNVTIEDDGKDVWCQPMTEYTKMKEFSQRGKSPIRKLRVLFGPRSRGTNDEGNHKCNWIIGVENSCYFIYQSRPSADNITLFFVNNGSDSEVEFNFSSSSDGDIHTISINKIQNSALSTQMFKLRILSSIFPQHPFIIPFDLDVVKQDEMKTSIIFIIIIGSSVAFLIILISDITIIIKRRRSKNNNTTTENNTHQAEPGMIDQPRGVPVSEGRIYHEISTQKPQKIQHRNMSTEPTYDVIDSPARTAQATLGQKNPVTEPTYSYDLPLTGVSAQVSTSGMQDDAYVDTLTAQASTSGMQDDVYEDTLTAQASSSGMQDGVYEDTLS